MKTHPAILFFLMTAFCYADPPAGKTATITVSYIGSDKKSLDATSPILSDFEVTLPLYISDTRHWTAHVTRESDNENAGSGPNKPIPANRFEMQINDLLALRPPNGDGYVNTMLIFNGTFEFESGKPVTVLKTSTYSIIVTVTLPEEKK